MKLLMRSPKMTNWIGIAAPCAMADMDPTTMKRTSILSLKRN